MEQQQQQNNQDQLFSTSQLYMWRCVVAMAHADDLIHIDELEYLNRIFKNMRDRKGMTEEQHNILLSDLKEKQDVGDLLRHINDPAYRSQVVYFARLLAFKDGEICPSEQALLDKLHAQIMDGVNLDEVRKAVHENVASEMIQHDFEIDQIAPDTKLYRLMDKFAAFLGTNIIEE